MSAPTHSVPLPRPAGRGAAQARLPWWGLALPLAAFAVLLLLPLAGPAGEAGRSLVGQPSFLLVVERVQQVLAGG